MNKRILSIGLAILMIFSISIPISFGTKVELKNNNINPSFSGFINSNTLYVGGDGPGNYTKIQDAINDANFGDTVFVFNGTYYENIVVNKSINLIGENKNITVIDGSNIVDTVNINIDRVSISEFTIQHGNEKAIIINSRDNIIKNNIITLNGYGISIEGDFHNNSIINNNISFNYLGIQIFKSSYNIISGNIITSHENCGIFLGESKYNNISSNNISKCGIGIKSQWDSGYNIFFNNDIWMNNDRGIYCIRANFNNFTNNSIRLNKYHGIDVLDWCYNNTFKGNIIDSNTYIGIDLGYAYNNIIIENSITNTTPEGVGIDISYKAKNNYIYHNNFVLNSYANAVDRSPTGDNFWDDGYPSGGNYWDDYFGIDLNRDGIGDWPYLFHLGKVDHFPLMKPFGKKSVDIKSAEDIIPRFKQNVFFKFLEMFPMLEKLLQISILPLLTLKQNQLISAIFSAGF